MIGEEEIAGKMVAGVDTHADTHWLCELTADSTSVQKLGGVWVDDLRSLLVDHERYVRAGVETHAAALSLARCVPETKKRRRENSP